MYHCIVAGSMNTTDGKAATRHDHTSTLENGREDRGKWSSDDESDVSREEVENSDSDKDEKSPSTSKEESEMSKKRF